MSYQSFETRFEQITLRSLEKIAREDQTTMAQIIREAVIEYINKRKQKFQK